MKTILKFAIIILVFIFSAPVQAQNNDAEKNNTALLIIDIQNFYFPGGMLPLNEPEKAAEKAQMVLNAFRDKGMHVIHIKHNASSGSEIHELVKPIGNEKIITKDKANAFVGTDLLDYLQNNQIKNLVLCGMQTHMCLEAATRAASDYGFNCTVIEDACTTRDLTYGDVTVSAKDVHYSTLNTLNKTYAKITTAIEFVKTLQ